MSKQKLVNIGGNSCCLAGYTMAMLEALILDGELVAATDAGANEDMGGLYDGGNPLACRMRCSAFLCACLYSYGLS